MFSFGSSSQLLLVFLQESRIKVLHVKLKEKTGMDILEQAEQPLPEKTIVDGRIEQPDNVASALKAVLGQFKRLPKKIPAVMDIPATQTYSVSVEGLKEMPKGPALSALVSEQLPFVTDELSVRQTWNGQLSPPTLSIVALELKHVRNLKMIFARENLQDLSLIPHTYGLALLAHAPDGPVTPTVLLDLLNPIPVMSLCLGRTVIDERALYGATPGDAFCETMSTWLPHLKKTIMLPSGGKAVASSGSSWLHRTKKEETPTQTAVPVPQVTKAPSTPPPATRSTSAQTVIPMTVFGKEEAPFDVSCRKIKDVSVVTQFINTDLDTLPARALVAAYQAKGNVPVFT